MDTGLTMTYLNKYIKKTTPLFKEFFVSIEKEAQGFSPVVAKTIRLLTKIGLQGKKFRGALVVLGYTLSGGTDFEAIYKTSLFAEIFHEALLVHDDIMDHADTRRGFPTIHKALAKDALTLGDQQSLDYGVSIAICAGDLLLNKSWSILAECSFPHDRTTRALSCFQKYFTRVVFGQMMDMEASVSSTHNEEQLHRILQVKSAEYSCVLPLCVGALLGAASDDYIKNLTKYGLNLGWAFQIQDDILGTFGSEEKTGKSVDSDIREGKQTLLVLHLRKHGTETQKNVLSTVLGNSDATIQDIENLKTAFRDAGSYKYIMNIGRQQIENGKKIIPRLTSDVKLQELLESFLDFMIERKK